MLPRSLQRWCWAAAALGLGGSAGLGADDSAWLEPFARLASPGYRAAADRGAGLRAELQDLPATPQFQQSGRLGFEIVGFMRPANQPVVGWIEIDLGRSERLDAVVLVPVDTPYRQFPGPGYGFPVRFKVEATGGRGQRTVADFTGADFANPKGLPVWLPAGGGLVDRVRITVTKPWWYRRAFSAIALGEVMLMRGNRNLAAGLPASAVRVSESFESLRVWSKDNLIDGQSVLGAPVNAQTSLAMGYHSALASRPDAVKWVQVDLGQPMPIDEVRLIGGTAAQLAGRPGFGFPVRFKVELADDPSFAAPRLLADHTADDFPNPAGNPVTLAAGGEAARYVRVTATSLWKRGEDYVFALSELQVYAGGRNVAVGRPVQSLDEYVPTGPAARRGSPGSMWDPSYLTDGFAGGRKLVEWPEFLRGLSRRREALEALEAAEREAGEAQRVAFGRLRLALMGAGAAGALGLWYSMRRAQSARLRALERLRQQIASDLHDEIGSNLGSIALLSEIGLRRGGEIARGDLEEICQVARQTQDSMRDIVELIQRPATSGGDCVAQLRAVAARMLAGLEWSFQADAHFELPSLAAQRHLLLAFKEALHNVRKHAAARRVAIELIQDERRVILRIADDGAGFDPAQISAGTGLMSLRHRAAALGGGLGIQTRPGAGTTLELSLDPRASPPLQ